jgi:hypothetical protein
MLERALPGMSTGFPAAAAAHLSTRQASGSRGAAEGGALAGFGRPGRPGEVRPVGLAAAVRVGAVEGWDGEEGRAVEEEPLDAIMGGDDGDDEL